MGLLWSLSCCCTLYGAGPLSQAVLGGPVGALPARYMHTEQAHSLPFSPVRRSSWHGMVTLLVYTPDQKVHAQSKKAHAPGP